MTSKTIWRGHVAELEEDMARVGRLAARALSILQDDQHLFPAQERAALCKRLAQLESAGEPCGQRRQGS